MRTRCGKKIMDLFRRFLRGSENRSDQHRTQRLHREAARRREDPVIYQVKMKLKKHSDPKYSRMSDEEMTKEAFQLTDQESLKEFFKELTHQPINTAMEEVAIESDDNKSNEVKQKHLDRVGQLTLKLHLSHPEETPSILTRLGAALLKIPYGLLRAALEIGDTSNPNISYIVEFNESSLVQPRKKNLLEDSALEATIPLGGARIKVTDSWTPPLPHAQAKLREKRGNLRTGIEVVDSYYCSAYIPIRPRARCMTSKERRFRRRATTLTDLSGAVPTANKLANDKVVAASLPLPSANHRSQSYSPPVARNLLSSSSDSDSAKNSSEEFQPKAEAFPTQNQPTLQRGIVTGEDLTPFVEMSLSKILLVEKLVKIVIKYNKNYYYHTVRRNCQSFITEVLQSFGVWENFKLGERLEVYLANLNKGRKEVYKSHKAVNDRVKYLIASGEIEETSYDEVRYLRSLFTIFHAEEFQASARPIHAVCGESDCMLHALEEHLKKKRPDGATRLLPPENYI